MEGTENLHQLTQLLSVVTNSLNMRDHGDYVNVKELYELEAKIIKKIHENL